MRIALDTSAYSAFMRGHEGVVDVVQRAEEIVLNVIVLGLRLVTTDAHFERVPQVASLVLPV